MSRRSPPGSRPRTELWTPGHEAQGRILANQGLSLPGEPHHVHNARFCEAPKPRGGKIVATQNGGYARLRVEGRLRIVKPREGASLRADGTSPRRACGPGRPRAAWLDLPPAPPAEDLDAVHRPIRGMQD